MKLTDEEKKEMREDGQDPTRRDHFRFGAHSRGPLTFEAYIMALDDIQLLGIVQPPRFCVSYLNTKL